MLTREMDLVTSSLRPITENNTLMHCQSSKKYETAYQTIFTIFDVIVGLPGNSVAMWIFCFRIKSWKPHILFLFNLAIADLLLIISLPFRIVTDLQGEDWIFGQAWCRINLFMLAVNRSASIAFMTAVTVDRYFKVVHPHHRVSHMTLTQAGVLTGLLWIVVIALRIPLLTINLLYEHGNLSLCRSFNSYEGIPPEIKLHYLAFIVEFILPWFLLLFCSTRIACSLHQRWTDRQKKMVRKATIAVVVISLVFTICFMPGVVTGLAAMYIKRFHPKNCTAYNQAIQCFMMSVTITYLNSSLDPVIYCFSSSLFRDPLKKSICCRRFQKKNDTMQNETITII
ncbi:hydroxycarboxylic acid receptor 2 [Echeneis naucrates]|uniref:Hydroxycarboxylic acid receptor 2-like n=1 Tax=Echeneis naucrates TaxID=173247 RepID=A0A665TZI5_ECHNA|nr:hydroxycarboxylic acid receptor 2-like [Echeneis naucrates]